jgi:hypothetical protein
MQCCRSGIFITEHDVYLSRIPDHASWVPDPGYNKATEEEREKIVGLPSFVDTNITKLKIILCLNRYRKKFEQIPQKILVTTQNRSL